MKRLSTFWWIIPFFVSLGGVQDSEYHIWSDPLEHEFVSLISRNDLGRQIYQEIVSRLRENNVPAEFVYHTFSHPEIRIEREVINRLLHPVENLPLDQYRNLYVTDERITMGVEFYQKRKDLIGAVADSFGVDPFLLLSIVGIESKYGTNSRQFPVFNALHTIIHTFPKKEKWVEEEMIEYLEFCYENFVPPHTIHGSYAGAFGYGQFISSSFNRFSVDFNGDGVRHPFDWPDVLASIANYLVRHGYKKGSTDFSESSRNWRAILSYNPSARYASAVVELRGKLISALNEQH
ncbi:MAG: lytic murein transglycosylase [Candidatus Neomarinimicrobiota bacterium]